MLPGRKPVIRTKLHQTHDIGKRAIKKKKKIFSRNMTCQAEIKSRQNKNWVLM